MGICKALEAVVELANSGDALEYVDALKVFMEHFSKGGPEKCEGITKKGRQCKRNALEGETMCSTHKRIGKSAKCQSIINVGDRCMRKAVNSIYCELHHPIGDEDICVGTGKDGSQCMKKSVGDSIFCGIHEKKRVRKRVKKIPKKALKV